MKRTIVYRICVESWTSTMTRTNEPTEESLATLMIQLSRETNIEQKGVDSASKFWSLFIQRLDV